MKIFSSTLLNISPTNFFKSYLLKFFPQSATCPRPIQRSKISKKIIFLMLNDKFCEIVTIHKNHYHENLVIIQYIYMHIQFYIIIMVIRI